MMACANQKYVIAILYDAIAAFGYYTAQTLTGHGNFAEKLHSFGLVESPNCECGLLDSLEHTLFVYDIVSSQLE